MGFPTETTPSEDYLAAKGVAFENNDSTLIDLNASDEIQVKDSYFTTPKTIKSIQLQLDDHDTQHLPNGSDPLATAIAVTLEANSTNTEGNNNSFARSNHTHEITKGTPITQTPDQTNAEGNSVGFARANHVHNIPTDTAVTVSTNGTNTQGNATTFSRANHTHKVEILSATVKANNTVTTTSATDVLLTAMTVTPAAGTYKIMCHAAWTLNQNTSIFFSVYVGGVQVTGSEAERQRTANANATQRLEWNYFDDVTVDGTQAIEIRWRRTAGAASAYDRQLSYMRVS